MIVTERRKGEKRNYCTTLHLFLTHTNKSALKSSVDQWNKGCIVTYVCSVFKLQVIGAYSQQGLLLWQLSLHHTRNVILWTSYHRHHTTDVTLWLQNQRHHTIYAKASTSYLWHYTMDVKARHKMEVILLTPNYGRHRYHRYHNMDIIQLT